MSDIPSITHSNSAPICFVHIPKTAVTSIGYSLTSLFESDEIFHGKTVYDYQEHSKEELAVYKYFSGHIQRDHFHKLPRNTKYFTFVRDPIKRTISHYRYFRKIFLSGEHSMLKPEERNSMELAGSMDIIDWVGSDDPFTIVSIRNPQTAQLVPSSMFWSEHPAQPEDILAEAYRVLANFFHVGVTEFLPACWEVLSWKLNRILPPLKTLNVTEGTDSFRETSEVRKKLAELCALDLELYHFCLKRTALEIQEYLDHLQSRKNIDSTFTIRR